MPARVRVYVWLIVVVAAAVLVVSPWRDVNWSAFVALGLFHVLYMRMVPARIRRGFVMSAIFAIVLAAIILLPPSAAGAVVGVGLVGHRQATTEARRTKQFYNIAQGFLSTAVGSAVYHALGGSSALRVYDFPEALGPIVAAMVATWVLNDVFVAAVVSLVGTERFGRTYRQLLKDGWLPRFGYGLLGILIAVLWNGTYGALAVVLAPVPVCVAGWAYMQYTAEERAYDGTIRSLIQAVEIKDYYTRGHSERVGRAAAMIGEAMRLKEKQVDMLRFAGMLHDIGKLSVPTGLLTKEGPLTPDERAVIQSHPVRGVDMVREIDFLDEAYNGIMHHHERFDGRGYPAGLAADRIPVFARIIAVADAFDCMTSTRSYRRARSVEEAVAELWHCAGTQFDPAMVRALVAALADLEARGEPWRPTTEPAAPPDAELIGACYDDDDPIFARLLAGEDPGDLAGVAGSAAYRGAGFDTRLGYGQLPDPVHAADVAPGAGPAAGVPEAPVGDEAERETP